MDKTAARQRIIEQFGVWSAHNIDLGDGVFTIQPQTTPEWTVRRAEYALAMAQIFTRKPANAMRALDIGCLEGGVTIALARRGVTAVGLEIRDEHLAKANFSREVLGLQNAQFIKGDMFELDKLNLGRFDLIVCAGTLYHVDAPALLPFLTALERHCSGVAVFDTHVAMEAKEAFLAGDIEIYGRSIVEHPSTTKTDAEKAARGWASRNNNHAFWPTERSLINLLAEAGFTAAFQPLHPFIEWSWKDRDFWVATSSALLRWPDVISERRKEPDQRPDHHPMLDLPMHLEPNPATRRLT